MNQPNHTPISRNRLNRPIPGMKLAYGSQAQQRPMPTQAPPAQSHKPANANSPGLFARLKESFFNLVTEESTTSNERPIGISRLSNTTFQSSPSSANRNTTSFFKSSQPIQDYRFNQLVDPHLTNPRR